jgi:hypothetical protein
VNVLPTVNNLDGLKPLPHTSQQDNTFFDFNTFRSSDPQTREVNFVEDLFDFVSPPKTVPIALGDKDIAQPKGNAYE